MFQLRKISQVALLGLSILTACGSDEENDPGQKTAYDRQAMLTNYSDNLIVPGYEAFKTETAQLSETVTAFVTNPTTATLAAARAGYQQAALAWQVTCVYEFGPGDQQMLRSNINIYPTATGQIENNIAAGSYSLQTAANLAAKGLPAIDYLLYGKPTEGEVLAQYTSDAQAANRKKYLQDVTNLVKQQAEATYTGWTGGYATTFKQSPGTAVGSAVGNLVNQLNFEIDLTKRAKVGIPAGKFTAGTPLPEKVEAYYSRASLELLKKAILAKKAIFMGQNAAGANGPGLDDYLNHVGAQYNNLPLSKAIEQQFDAALTAANAIPVPLAEAVTAQPQLVNKVYEELQKLIVLTKTDMPAALGVTISYTDNDGD
jgi:uncharacterized protein